MWDSNPHTSRRYHLKVVRLPFRQLGINLVPRAGLEPARTISAQDFKSWVSAIPPPRHAMAGAEGFEPSHTGVKVLCLTAWLHPNNGASTKNRT